jgi:hypothetical protein
MSSSAKLLFRAAPARRRLGSVAPARAFGSAAPAPPAPPASGSLAWGLNHLRGETKAPAHKSPMGGILGTFVWFGLAGGLGWAVAQPGQAAEQLGEAATAAIEAVKQSLPGASSGSSDE